jgi:hypothetical protein
LLSQHEASRGGHRTPSHRYTLDDFGLSSAEVDDRFAAPMRRPTEAKVVPCGSIRPLAGSKYIPGGTCADANLPYP